MPLYEYVCSQCGAQFEKMVRLSEVSLKPICPSCGSAETNKQLSKIAIATVGATTSSSCSSSGSSFR